jgi:dephospho-CoA kinase
VDPVTAIFGAVAGYLSLWSVYWRSSSAPARKVWATGTSSCSRDRRVRRWQGILPVLLLSSFIGAIVGSIMLAVQGRDRATPIPFGPYLAAAGWVQFLLGPRSSSPGCAGRYIGGFVPYIVGLTGGIASGKSEVARRFAELGVPVLDADAVTRELTTAGQPALAEIVKRFGKGALAPDGSLDRGAMRARIFDDAESRRALEHILHPRVEVELRSAALAQAAPLVIVAVPLLAEVGRYEWLDRVLLVDCDPARQRERLMRRDGIDAALADRMLAAQAGRGARIALADDVIENLGDLAQLRDGVDRAYVRLSTLANAKAGSN